MQVVGGIRPYKSVTITYSDMSTGKTDPHAFSLFQTLLLAAVLVFHAGLVFRFRFVRLFPAEWIGYAALGIIFSCVALLLLGLARLGDRSVCEAVPKLAAAK